MNRYTKKLLPLWLFTTLLAACSDDPVIHNPVNRTIDFSTDLLQTRGSVFTDTGSVTAFKTMGVYAANSAGDFIPTVGSSGTTVSLMQDQKLERNQGSSGWYYTPSVPWQGTDKHSFFAYAPHTPAPAGLTLNNLGGIPRITYVVPPAVKDQTDLLVAKAQYNLTATPADAVKLIMNHALTRVVFSAKTQNSVHADSIITIPQIRLTNIRNTGTRAMDFNSDDLWTVSSDSNDKQLYVLSTNSDGGLEAVLLNQSFQPLNTPTGNLFLMPQHFTDDSAILEVTYRITHRTDAGYKETVLVKKISEILDEWRQSEAIRFLITIPNTAEPETFTVDVTYTDWLDHTTSVELPSDPFLDVTNVDVHTYDAAVTRVYFYTNQRNTVEQPNAIRIDSLGREGSNYGAFFPVSNEFQSLVASDASGAGANNFHFDNNTGKGYIDLVNVHTSTAGDHSNNGKKLLILKLRAGALVRDIAVQPVVTTEAAKQDTTRFVGTFHRHNETGERIVTWHLPDTTSWIATIDQNIGSHASLCIDRFASPDFANNILFSASPRNPEGAKVDPALRTVSGKGRLYFRVGWKTPSLSNRYARIVINTSNSSTSYYIYCRQGETEETIQGASVLFSVYNVSQFRQFTQYPSQAGMLYQWNRTRAWDPLSKNPPPAYPSTTDPTFAYERSACPEGYLYPSTAEQTQMTAVLGAGGTAKQWGYYADGFFDRRAVEVGDYRVEASTLGVAGAGLLFFNAATARAIFLPTTGYRDSNDDVSKHGQLLAPGTHSGYWTDLNGSDPTTAVGAILFEKATQTAFADYRKTYGFSLRCVKAEADGVNKASIVRFDANGGENAPVSLTVRTSVVSVSIPNTKPDNYYLEGYQFKEWNTKKTGGGTVVQPGGSFPLSNNVDTLFAQWEEVKNPFITINYAEYIADPATYLLNSSDNTYTNYTLSTLDSRTNGTVFDAFSSSNPTTNDIISNEKAYPYLVFGEISSTDVVWSTAYTNCKNSEEGGFSAGTWRLPRASELAWMTNDAMNITGKLKKQIDPAVRSQLFNVSKLLWSGTDMKRGTTGAEQWATYAYSGGVDYEKNLSTPKKYYRCVRQVSP